MKIGIIGYGNQAKKIIKFLEKVKKVKNIIVFKKTKFTQKLNKTILNKNDLSNLNNVDCVFICSPNSKHFFYLNILY